MDKDNIKTAFQKVKQDIYFLGQEIAILKEILTKISKKIEKNTNFSKEKNSTENTQIQTISTHSSTHDYAFKPLKPQNLPISTGNQGASTDRQTDRHIDKHPFISYEKPDFLTKNTKNTENAVDRAAEVLESLDNIKKEIRLKFKQLTKQEILVFSAIYQLEEEKGFANYKTIAHNLKLSTSSIRDYVSRLIKKGIPVEKKRINNKQVQLSISPNLKKIATLPTILQLRDI